MKSRIGVNVANGGALALALGLALYGGLDRAPRTSAAFQPVPAVTSARRHPLPGGGEGIADASGRVVPLRSYRRIVSTNMLSDGLLIELSEPDRVLAVGAVSVSGSPFPWRFAGKAVVDGMGPLEAIIALKPDLVLMNVFGSEARTEKLRNAGIEVFNLGELRGLATFLPTAEIVAELLGDGERGRRFARDFLRRMKRVAAPLGTRPRRRAVYLSVIAGRLLGGTRGTSYHDVITHAGLVDAAAEAGHVDWPLYRPEQLSAMDPDLIVTKHGMAEAICGHPGLDRLRVCRSDPPAIITLPEAVLEDPGVGMLNAAEQIFAAAYPGL